MLLSRGALYRGVRQAAPLFLVCSRRRLSLTSGNMLFSDRDVSSVPIRVSVHKAWRTCPIEEERAQVLATHRAFAAAIAEGDAGRGAAAGDCAFEGSIGTATEPERALVRASAE